MNIFKNLGATKRRDSAGPLSGRTLPLDPYTVKVEEVVGQGGFATIYRAVDVVSGEMLALKHFRLSGDPDAERDAQTEARVMRALKKVRDTLALRGSYAGQGEFFLLLDFCEETLAGHIATRGTLGLTEAEIIAAFLPVARAVAAMHSLRPPMAHRDVKAENVLRRRDGSWVLCDFGSATAEQKVYSTPLEISREEERIRKQTTPAYRAPELWDLYSREFIGVAVDVWALGCLLYLLAYAKLPFDGESKLQILNGSYRVPPGRPPAIEALIADMLVVDPKARITAEDVVLRATALAHGQWDVAPKRIRGREISTVDEVPSKPSNQPNSTQLSDWADEFARAARSDTNPHGLGMPSAPPVVASTPGKSNGMMGSNSEWADFGTIEASGGGDTSGNDLKRMPTSVSRHSTGPRSVEAVSASRPQSRASESLLHRIESGSRSGRSSSAATEDAAVVQHSKVNEGSQQLGLDPTALHDHCQVLEQLLETRQREIATLQAEIRRHAEEAERARASEIDISRQLSELRVRFQAQEESLAHARELVRDVDTLRAEVDSFRNQLTQQGDVINGDLDEGGVRRHSNNGGRSTSAASFHSDDGRSRNVSSFPVAVSAGDVNAAANELGGAPMRPGSRSSAGRSSPSRTDRPLHKPRVPSAEDMFFKELNPLG